MSDEQQTSQKSMLEQAAPVIIIVFLLIVVEMMHGSMKGNADPSVPVAHVQHAKAHKARAGKSDDSAMQSFTAPISAAPTPTVTPEPQPASTHHAKPHKRPRHHKHRARPRHRHHHKPRRHVVVGKNDYPWRGGSMGAISPLRFSTRFCTDYTAWEINRQMGGSLSHIKFGWQRIESGGHGNAVDWRLGAIQHFGPRSVNQTPAVGSVAWWGSEYGSGAGHVAIVKAVSKNHKMIVVADYNHGDNGRYGVGRIRKGRGGYLGWPDAFLHLADVH